MTELSDDVNGSIQPQMFATDIYEITLKIGVMPLQNHAQLQIEVREHPNDELIRLQSIHHCDIERLHGNTGVFFALVREAIDDVLDPFRTL